MMKNSRISPRALLLASLLLGVAVNPSAFAQVDIETMPDPTPAPSTTPESETDKSSSAPRDPEKSDPAPTSPQARAKILEDLYSQLAKAPDAAAANPVAEAIQRVWLFSGSDTTDLLMMRAQQALTASKPDLAITMLDAIVELQPDFAEGWHRRAYVYALKGDLERALGDIRRALALEPKHFKALESMGGILRQLNNKKTALEALKKVLEINPQSPGLKQTVEELEREVEGQGI